MAHDVFVSHSVKDKVVADAIVARLEADGVRCWVAPRDVVPGADWGESIVNAIESSRIMILVFSRNANASRQIKREVERADDKGVYTIPFRIDDIEPTKSLEYFISTAQWMNAFSPPLEPHLDVLTQTVATVLASSPRTVTAPNESNRPEITPAAVAGEQVSEPRPRTASERRAPLPLRRSILSIALAAMLVAVGAGWYFGRERSRPQKTVIPERAEEPRSLTKRVRDADGLQVPERKNPVPKVGAPAASAPALLAEKQPPSAPPADVVRRYYGQINERSVDQAYACLSRNFKTRLSRERFSNVFAETQTIVIRQLNEVSLGDAEAVLAIEFVETDRDNHWHNWIGNIYLVKEGETWRIDRTSLKSELLGEVMPNTAYKQWFCILTAYDDDAYGRRMAAEDCKTFERKLSATNSQYKVAIFKAKNGKLAVVLDSPGSEAAANALVSYAVAQGLSKTAYAKLGYGWTPNP